MNRVRLRKDALVDNWWRKCLKYQTQFWGMEGGVLSTKARPWDVHARYFDTGEWAELTSTEVLWHHFAKWLKAEASLFAKEYTKAGFIMMLRRVADVEKSTIGVDGKRIRAIKFKPLEYYKQADDAG